MKITTDKDMQKTMTFKDLRDWLVDNIKTEDTSYMIPKTNIKINIIYQDDNRFGPYYTIIFYNYRTEYYQVPFLTLNVDINPMDHDIPASIGVDTSYSTIEFNYTYDDHIPNMMINTRYLLDIINQLINNEL